MFCSQTFINAAEKDVHVLKHLATETYDECNRIEHLIRNGTKLTNEDLNLRFVAENIRPHFLMPNSMDLGKEHWNTNQPAPLPPPPPPPQQQPPQQPSPTKTRRRGGSKVSCDLCGQLFHRYALYRHRRDVHNPTVCECELCNTKFKSQEYLQRHMQYKHGIGAKNLTCGTCNKTFRSEVSLQTHPCGSTNSMVPGDPGKEYWTDNYVEQQKPKQKLNDRVECEYCGKSFHIFAIYRHRRDVHNQIVCVCEVCNTKFKSKEYLHRHMQYKHGIGGKNLTCLTCNRTFRSEVSLQTHPCGSASTSTNADTSSSASTSTSTNDTKVQPVPGKEGFDANYSEEQKPKPKEPRERVACDLCGQFFHHYALYRHRRDVHHPINISCHVCNTKFKSEEYLHRHMQYKHGVGKNLTCDTCNKTFRSDVSLQTHQCTGMNLQPNQSLPPNPEPNENGVDQKPPRRDTVTITLTCDICGKADFDSDQSLLKHKAVYHTHPNGPNWNQYPGVSQPPKAEPSKNGNINHKAPRRSNITCDICGKGSFDCEQSLQKHKIIFHSHPSAPVWNPHWIPPIL